MTIDKPNPEEHPDYYSKYISKATWSDVLEAHTESLKALQALLINLPEEKWNYRYAADKWTIKDIVGHLIDTERIMTYRAVAIARKESQALPGFEEKDYAKNNNASGRSSADLLDEIEKARTSSIAFLQVITL